MTSIELVTVTTDGKIFSAWDSMAVTAGGDEAARSFTLACAAEIGTRALAWVFAPGKLVEVKSNGDLLCAGYTDKFAPRIGEKSADITISGRSKSADLVDCSALDETGCFKQMPPDAIIKKLAEKFDVDIRVKVKLEPVDYQVTPGETIFAAADKMLRSQGATMRGAADGGLEIVGADDDEMAGEIVEGRDFKIGTATHDWSKRYSETRVRGQRPVGVTDEDMQIEAVARDRFVKRHRPRLVVNEDDTTRPRARKRAKQERDRSAGAGLTASFTLQGFRDSSGALWRPGALVPVQSPFLLLDQKMRISSVAWRQGPGATGSTSALSLVDPRAHGGKAGRADKSGEAWEMDASDAE